MPVGIEDESSGLDEFVVKVYLPQLEEKVSELVQLSLGGEFPFLLFRSISFHRRISPPFIVFDTII